MRKKLATIPILLIIFLSASCVTLREQQKSEYGQLMTAVTMSSDKVYGEYGDNIPDDFTGEKFMAFIKDQIPEEFYNTLRKYRIEIRPKGSYYLLLVSDLKNGKIILFDYSCTVEPDGRVWLEPDKYDLNNLDQYDTCKPKPTE